MPSTPNAKKNRVRHNCIIAKSPFKPGEPLNDKVLYISNRNTLNTEERKILEERQIILNQSMLRSIFIDDYKSASEFLEYGADPNAQNSFGHSALHLLALKSDSPADSIYLGNRDIPINLDKLLLINLIVSKGGRLDLQDNAGNTPLHLACISGNPGTFEHLLKLSVNNNVPVWNIRNREGKTIQQLADGEMRTLLEKYSP